ncbi:TIGR03943 family protein [Nakamurella silvestris]|nr:TIGR03943 family protein [Nakamurella silvestris]
MNRETQSIVTIMLGGLIAAITASGRFTSYVKPGFEPILWAASVILVLVGVITLVMTIREEVREAKAVELARVAAAERGAADHGADHGHDVDGHDWKAHDSQGHDSQAHDLHGHDHSRSKAAWLLMVPVLVLLLVPPNALGADSVVRSATSQDIAGEAATVVTSGSGTTGSGDVRRTMPFPPLTAGGTQDMTMKEFVMRTLYDAQDSTSKGSFVIQGFIVPVSKGYDSGYGIARLVISCCAADANPMQVHIEGDAPLPVNTWVTATVTAVAQTGNRENQYVPTVTVTSMDTISQPKDPYEH